MSDGHTDAACYVNERFDEFLELLVSYYESIGTNMAPMDDQSRCLTGILEAGRDLNKYSSDALWDYLNEPVQVFVGLLQKVASGGIPSLEELLLALLARGEFSKIIRLQKVTALESCLLVFADCNGRVCKNGIYYSSRMKFMGGDEDIVLGYAKKRFREQLLLEHIQGNIHPYLVVADWHQYRKRWMVRSIYFS